MVFGFGHAMRLARCRPAHLLALPAADSTPNSKSVRMRLAGQPPSALGKRMPPQCATAPSTHTVPRQRVSRCTVDFAVHEWMVTCSSAKRCARMAHVRGHRAGRQGRSAYVSLPRLSATGQPDSIARACGFVQLSCGPVQDCAQSPKVAGNGALCRPHCGRTSARKRFDERPRGGFHEREEEP